MDLSNLKNIDVNDLFNKLKSGGLADKKLLIKFGIGFGAVLIFLIIYYIFVSPKIAAQEEKIKVMNENREKIIEFNNDIGTLEKAVKKLKPEYEKNSKLFHSKKEVEGLYQSISNFALANSLTIINLVKGNPEPAGGGDQNQNNQGNNSNAQSDTASYYTIPVDYEIRGTFLGYLKFRRALSKSMKVINFDSEEIKLLNEPRGQVLSKGTISIVGLPDEYN